MIKTDKNLSISADSQPICTKLSERGLFFSGGQNESQKYYVMIKTDKNFNISADSQLIYTKLSEQGLFFLRLSKWVQEVLCYDQNWTKKLTFPVGSQHRTLNTETKMDLIQIAYYPADSHKLFGFLVKEFHTLPSII